MRGVGALCAILCGVPISSPAQEAASSEDQAISPTTILPLFNGTDLTGLYTWLVDTKRQDPRGVFSVTNGMIRISGDGLGYLSTARAYRDYRLVVEFKWGSKNWAWGDRIGAAKDSGIFLHSIGPDGNSHDGNGAFKAAIECQVMQGAVGDFLLIRGSAEDGSLIAPRVTVEVAPERDADGWFYWKKGGQARAVERWGRINWAMKCPQWKDVYGFRGERDVESPDGEWTRLECICEGDRITVKVNGKVVNEAREVFPKEGKILLQCEGSEIFFRRFELHPMNGGREGVDE
jgi:hypothetical protein